MLLKDEVKESLCKFFDTLNTEAEPHASKAARLTTQLVLKDDNNNIELTSLYTTLMLYSCRYWDRGWGIQSKGDGRSYGELVDYP